MCDSFSLPGFSVERYARLGHKCPISELFPLNRIGPKRIRCGKRSLSGPKLRLVSSVKPLDDCERKDDAKIWGVAASAVLIPGGFWQSAAT
jgi:hypothetical protein